MASSAEPHRPTLLARARGLRAGMPLAWKLALMTTALLAACVAGLLFAVHGTLVDGAAAVTRARLTRVARDLAGRTETASRPRIARMQAVAASPALRRALRAGPGDTAAVAAARSTLAALGLHARDTAVVELWDARGGPVTFVGEALPAAMRAEQVPLDNPAQGGAWHGALRVHRGQVHIWTLVPVDADGERLGYVAMMRWVRGARTLPQQLRTLTGEDVELLIRNADASLWSTAWGAVQAPPDRRDSTEEGPGYWRDGRRSLVVEAAVPNAPWVIVLEAPERTLLAGPRATMRRLALIGLVLVLAGAVIAWRLGRRITRPLSALTLAAADVARGTYEHAVPRGGGNELDRLTSTFDVMARQVAGARTELERRANDAQEYAAELARANTRLEDAITAAERASRAKGDFLAVMSHELRTPLNAIGGYAELLSLGIYGDLSAEQRDALARLTRSQRHLLGLIDDVLSFARLEGGQTRYEIRDVALEEVLASVEPLVAPQARARSLALEIAACASTLVVRADADKVRQIVVNLVANAIKFTPEGGRIVVSCEADEHVVRLHVADTGPGIASDRMEAIFEPFVQGDRALNRPSEGVGLGLAISRDLARGMGGTLTVASRVGRGATFTVTLPRVGSGVPTTSDVGRAAAASLGVRQ